MYQTEQRVSAVAVETCAGRQYEWRSSPTPTVNPAAVDCSFIPVMQNSQFPAVGVPDPPPTEFPTVSASGTDCRAGGVVPKETGWVNVPDH